MKILFVHQNIPGQYKHLARRLALDPTHDVRFVGRNRGPEIAGLKKALYRLHRDPDRSIHPYLRPMESAVLHGQAVARVLHRTRAQGFVPDIICGHPGWGELLYVKDVYPEVPLLNYCEFFYRSDGADVAFEEEKAGADLDRDCRVRTKNAHHLISLDACDAGVSPTEWQRSQFPSPYRHKIALLHDGIDTGVVRPAATAEVRLPNGVVLRKGDEVVTYVARGLEPYRGFPNFLRAMATVCARRKRCHAVVIGGDSVRYGAPLPAGVTHRSLLTEELAAFDMSRVHFVGLVPYEVFLRVLQVSAVHVYLTYPFVLSWSVLEAMAAECLVVGSDTPPVVEVIRDGVNGLLVDFFSPEQIAARVEEVLDHPTRMQEVRSRARETIVERYGLESCLDRSLELMVSLIDGYRPTPSAPMV